MMDASDDPVERIVDTAVAAMTRMMLAYMEQMRSEIRREAAAAVRGEFAGDQFYVGKDCGDRAAVRNQAIMADRVAGLSVRAIAKKRNVSKTHVARVLEKEVSRSLVKSGTGGGKNEDEGSAE